MAAATEQRTLTITVPPDATGRTLLDYISSRFTYLDRTHWLAEIESGRLSLDCANAGGQKNGAPAPATTPAAAPAPAPAQPDAVLCTGALISWTGAPVEEPEVDENWSVLLETDDYLFINKPAGLPVHPAGRYRTHTLWNLLLERYGSLFFVNRLDRETSGVLLAAKNSAAAREAQTLMQSGLADKEYLVLVEGNFAHELDAVGYLENDASSPVRKALRFVSTDGTSAPERVIDAGARAWCKTQFAPLALLALPGSDRTFTLLRAQLFTGRTHQIRATLKSLGYPVAGDKLYGHDSEIFLRFIDGKMTDDDRTLLVLPYQALHAARFSISLPSGTLEGAAPLPAFWSRAFPDLE